MKRLLCVLGLLFLALGISATVLTPSQAAPAAVAASQAPAAVATAQGVCYGPADVPVTVSGCKFWNRLNCIDGSAINGAYYRVANLAQAWNIEADYAGGGPGLNYSDDCAAAGYTPSRRMVVGISHGGASGQCVNYTNTTTSVYNGMARWTNSPGFYLNQDNPACVGTQTRRDHAVSLAIGQALGLASLNSSGWSGRVMYGLNYSLVGEPTAADGGVGFQIYQGTYCVPQYSGC